MRSILRRMIKASAILLIAAVMVTGIVFARQWLMKGRLVEVADLPSVNVAEFGAVGDANHYNASNGRYYADKAFKKNATDNTAAFRKALKSGKQVIVPAGNYLICGKLELEGSSVRIVGNSKQSRIIITSLDFRNIGAEAYGESAIINKNFGFSYAADEAQELVLENIILEYRRDHGNSPKTLLLLGNMDKVEIRNVEFNCHSATQQQITNLDFYAACKNVTVENCVFLNDTGSRAGGCIWVRNLTTKKERVSGNNTENVLIRNNKFSKNSNDEIIAVYSVRGDIYNVAIENNVFETFGRPADLIFNIESSEDPYYGVAQNISFTDNRIDIHEFNYFVMKLGNEKTKKNVTKNVLVANNVFNIKDTANTRNKWVIYQADKVSENIRIDGNTINNTNDNGRIHGIYCLDTIENNRLNGFFMQAVLRGMVRDNVIKGANVGLSDPYLASGNVIMNVNTGIEVMSEKHYLYDNLIITRQNPSHAGTGIAVWDTGSKSTTVYVVNNHITASDPDDAGSRIMKGEIFLKGNNFSGHGESIVASSGVKVNLDAKVPSLSDIASGR